VAPTFEADEGGAVFGELCEPERIAFVSTAVHIDHRKPDDSVDLTCPVSSVH
jgi:hypothetical protein